MAWIDNKQGHFDETVDEEIKQTRNELKKFIFGT